ncbi:MAG: hypothetical protein LBQ24_02295 [Candidatus Peribacteria bacterium]|nr:hypothetical protein [Candidatus Peribacteria bacterium]
MSHLGEFFEGGIMKEVHYELTSRLVRSYLNELANSSSRKFVSSTKHEISCKSHPEKKKAVVLDVRLPNSKKSTLVLVVFDLPNELFRSLGGE